MPVPLPHRSKDIIKRTTWVLLEDGVIRNSQSSFVALVVLVKKKDGQWRMCMDYLRLNDSTVKDKFLISLIEELLDKLGGSTWFSKLDLRYGYYQVRMDPDDIHKIAFRTHEGHYEFLMMPFSLTNAPATFQTLMNHVFQPLLRKGVLVVFDDILVYSRDVEQHKKNLRHVLSIMKEHQLFAKESKRVFGGRVVEFLGLAEFYRRFIQSFGIIAKPLTDLLKKDAFKWGYEAQRAFKELKSALTSAPVLALPDFSKQFVIETDASGYRLDAVLMQEHHPISDLSKALSPKQQTLSVYEKELLAILMAVKQWHYYLITRPFIIRTDQNSLKHLLAQKVTTQVVGEDIREGDIELQTIKEQIKKGVHLQKITCYGKWLSRKNRMIIGGDARLRTEIIKLWHDLYWGVIPELMQQFNELRGCFIGREFLALQGAKAKLSMAYHPQTDGQTKVVNRCLECYLKCMVMKRPHPWVKLVALVEWWYNTTFHSSIGKSPFEALYGFPPPFHIPYIPKDAIEIEVDEFMRDRDADVKLLKQSLQKAQNRMKQQADKHRTDREFEVGSWVYLKFQPYKQNTLRVYKYSKLTLKYFGPFLVVERVGKVAYRLDLPDETRIHPFFHVSLLKLTDGPPDK
nr:gypsy/Ty3 element polyprotein, putative [Tanacetum cinerariifolium]